MVIAVDVDGTILDWPDGGWQGPDVFGEPKPGAIEVLAKLKEMGHYIIIFSCRTNVEFLRPLSERTLVKTLGDGLRDIGVPFDDIAVYKPTADLYIDDKAIKFTDWGTILKIFTLEK